MRIFEVDDEAEAGVGGAAQDICGLGDDVLRFDRLAFELVLGKRLLKSGIGEIVVRLIAEPALRDDERDGLFSRSRRCDRSKAQGEGRKRA